MRPNSNNACSGRYHDWLEVNLTPRCNASCSWCVERRGWHPDKQATWQELVSAALATGAANVILLGGEPTLHPHFREIVAALSGRVRLWVTTNGSRLTWHWVVDNLAGVHGVNCSIHSDSLEEHHAITGLRLSVQDLRGAVRELDRLGAVVRFNCNCIRGHVDTRERIERYCEWASWMGASGVRFAELKFDDERFVDLAALFLGEHGLNDDPFRLGCSTDTVIGGLPVNFRQMCGLQTTRRPCPVDPEFGVPGGVLYYDGVLYNGWQVQREGGMNEAELKQLMDDVAAGRVSAEEAARRIAAAQAKVTPKASSGGFCQY